MIHYLRHEEIDRAKWEICLEKSVNRLVYAMPWYLDIVSPAWEALVENDYERIMPLPAKQKFLLPYLIHPRHVQQLGIFSALPIDEDKVADFLKKIPAKFLWRHFFLNSNNNIIAPPITSRVNFELLLTKDYHDIYQGYHENTQRNIKKAKHAGLSIKRMQHAYEFLEYYQYNSKTPQDSVGLAQLKNIIDHSVGHRQGVLVATTNPSGKVIAGAFFLEAMQRIIYLASFNTAEGQEQSAMFLLMDDMIKTYSQQPYVFDFEGSMIPGIARFFAGFGATRKTYPQYKQWGWKVKV